MVHFFSASVPPEANETISKNFQELSRIHFYLGKKPIEPLIEAVEKASPKEIEKGKIQIFFATKEISNYLFKLSIDISIDSKKQTFDNPISTTLHNILENHINFLEQTYKSPLKPSNPKGIEAFAILTNEIALITQTLSDNGINTVKIEENIETIKEKHNTIKNLGNNYPTLADIKHFNDYQQEAKKSIVKQLETPYSFNYDTLARIYQDYDRDWIQTLKQIRKEQKDIDTNPDYPLNEKEAIQLQNDFVAQIKSFNRIFNDGIINNLYGAAIIANFDAYQTSKKQRENPETWYKKELQFLEKKSSKSNNETLQNFKDNKEAIINKRIENLQKESDQSIMLSFKENRILSIIEKIKENTLSIKPKKELSLNGDINNGFVTGFLEDNKNILLIHKDPFVTIPDAIYVISLEKEKYEQIKDTLVFNEKTKNELSKKCSNFFSYSNFIEEIKMPKVQKFFLDEEFLIKPLTKKVKPK